jgi:translation initiation factor 2 alpha subunit (eIF-2alpha)
MLDYTRYINKKAYKQKIKKQRKECRELLNHSQNSKKLSQVELKYTNMKIKGLFETVLAALGHLWGLTIAIFEKDEEEFYCLNFVPINFFKGAFNEKINDFLVKNKFRSKSRNVYKGVNQRKNNE